MRSHVRPTITGIAQRDAAEIRSLKDLEGPLGHTIADLHAIATGGLANGDDYARALLREQLEQEEFSESSNITPGTE